MSPKSIKTKYMISPIKLHWSNSKPNFGDQLAPLICELASKKKIIYADISHCDLLSIGSILQRLKERPWSRTINVWGSGYISPTMPHKSKHIYHAIRGKHSASCLSNITVKTYGDPALLADQLITQPNKSKRYIVGIIPHYKDYDTEATTTLEKKLKQAIIIDVFKPPLDVISHIAQCHYILSSSLHGLIVADSLQIPNCHIKISNNIRGGDWKFNDYYSIFDRPAPAKLALTKIESITDVTTALEDYSRPGIHKIKDALLRSFPSL